MNEAIPTALMTAGQLNRLDDESASLVHLLHYPVPGADFHRIITACNELRYACLGTHATPNAPAGDHSPGMNCARDAGPRCETPCGLAMCAKEALTVGAEQENRYAEMIGQISDALGLTEAEQFEADGADKILAAITALKPAPASSAPTIAECITQLDVWNGYLEAAIDRQALERLGQHQNDEPSVGRDPLEQLP